MRQLIAGNWKMNGLLRDGVALADALRQGCEGLDCDLLVCPPATLLRPVAESLAGSAIAVGGQDCHAEPKGAHTGDISAPMLRDAGASWVILGHSERRTDHHETDELAREKVLAAVAAGLTPIVCVGETQEQRQSGRETEIVGWQISGSLPDDFAGVIAYEPIWAIGAGRTATERDVGVMFAFIREELKRQFGDAGQSIRILYGGSVKPDNAGAILAVPEVGGALVGGASSGCRRVPCNRPGGAHVGGRRARPLRFARGPVAARTRRPPQGPSMATVLTILDLFITIALIGVVLIQRSEGGGLGIGSGGGGMGSFMTGRGTANLLTRTTAVLAALFMALSLVLALMNRGTVGAGRTVLEPPRSRQVAPVMPPLPGTPGMPEAPSVPVKPVAPGGLGGPVPAKKPAIAPSPAAPQVPTQ